MSANTRTGVVWHTWRGHGGRVDGVERWQPWIAAGAGLMLGVAWVLLVWGRELAEVWDGHLALAQARRAGTAVQSRAQAPAPLDTAAATTESTSLHWTGPARAERDGAWLWLQQRLQAQGLQVEVLRPEAVHTGAVLASQSAHLRLQGAWTDWVAFGEQLLRHAPWWTWEQWLVQPADAPGRVQVDARWRLWLRPDGAAPDKLWAGPVWPVVPAQAPVPLFARAHGPASEPASPAHSAVPASSPGWRLWGVWTQDGHHHAVLGQGHEWRVLAPGQRLEPEAWRLERIAAEGVHLKGLGPGPALFLPWEGAP